MKNIVVLDAHTLSPLQPGEHSPFHPDWDALTGLGPVQLFPRTQVEEVIERAQEAQVLLTNKAVVNADHIAALPKLEYIGVMATGYNVVDLAAARARGIPVTNIPGYSTASVAQHVFALLLELAARVGATDAAVKNGDWVRCPDFCFTVAPFFEMAGKTLGVVGYGTIGQAVARIGSALGMRIIATSRSQRPSEVPVEWVTQEDLFAQSDVITLHCPLTDETRGMINQANIGKMKRSVYLINTGRGPLIDEAALASALNAGRIAGFGADVLSTEPPARDNPLLAARNTIITPHIAWASVEARTRLMGFLVENIRAFFAGTPANVVNGVIAAAAASEALEATQQEPTGAQPESGGLSAGEIVEASAAGDSVVEEIAEPVTETAAEAPSELMAEASSENSPEPISESMTESPAPESASEESDIPAVEESASQPSQAAALEEVTEPVAESSFESASEYPSEPFVESSAEEFLSKNHPEPISEPLGESQILEPAPEPSEGPAAEALASQPPEEPAIEEAAEPVTELTAEPALESTEEPSVEEALIENHSGPISETATEMPASEPTSGQPDSVPAETASQPFEDFADVSTEQNTGGTATPFTPSLPEQPAPNPEPTSAEDESAEPEPSHEGEEPRKI